MDIINEISRLRKIFAETDFFGEEFVAGALTALDSVAKYFDDDTLEYYVKMDELYLHENDGFVFKKENATVFSRREIAEAHALITGRTLEVAE